MEVDLFIKSGKYRARPLRNPLAAEFGIYTQEDLDDFIDRQLPTFALVCDHGCSCCAINSFYYSCLSA